MNNIKITDNKSEMIQIGKEIFEAKSNIYNEKMCSSIMSTINVNMPDASEEEKQNTLYRSVYNYWVYGNNIAEEFYFDFANKSHEEKSAYVTFRSRYLYLGKLNKKEATIQLNDKYQAYQILKPYYKRDVIQIESEQDFEIFSDFVDKHSEFVAKPAGLGLAIGVHKASLSEYNSKKEMFDALLAEGKDAKSTHTWGASCAVVLEELIEQADSMAVIHPQSCNTVRITTLRVGDKIYSYRPWFKIGANGKFVTSAAQGSLCAGIDGNTGIVDSDAFDERGVKFPNHPQTNVQIKGFAIPQWEQLIEMAMEVATYFPDLSYIGWDFALTPEGWCIMEGNCAGEFMWQLIYEKGMKAEIEEIMNWSPEQEFWWKS